jgi:hypothetical protein
MGVATLGIVLAVIVALGLVVVIGAVIGLIYLINFRVGPGPSGSLSNAAASLDVREIQGALDGAVRMTSGRLPSGVQAQVAEIRREILELLPSTGAFPLGSEDLYVIQRTATDYLPTTLKAYLALPQGANTQVMQDGKTPLQMLGEQLQILDDRLDEIGAAVHQQDSAALVANGRFLEERFGRGPDGLALPPEP